MHLAQELLTNIRRSSGSRIFPKGDESLEDDEAHSGRWLKVDNDWLNAIIRAGADPLTTTQEDTEELNVDSSTVIQHLRQIGKVKKLDKWVPHELTENLKKKNTVILKCHLFLYITTMNHIWIGLWCAMKVDGIWQLETTSSVAGLRRSSNAVSKAKPAPKKGHGHCLVVCCLSDPL